MIGAGRAYAVTFTAVSVSASQELFYIKPAADKPCVVEAVYVSNVGGAADAGDTQEELLRIEMLRLPATVTASTGGTAPTPSPMITNDAAAGFTARVNDTGLATTSGTALTLHADGWNVRAGFVWMPPPEHRPIVANAQAIVVRLNSTPADALTVSGTCIVRELP